MLNDDLTYVVSLQFITVCLFIYMSMFDSVLQSHDKPCLSMPHLISYAVYMLCLSKNYHQLWVLVRLSSQ